MNMYYIILYYVYRYPMIRWEKQAVPGICMQNMSISGNMYVFIICLIFLIAILLYNQIVETAFPYDLQYLLPIKEWT